MMIAVAVISLYLAALHLRNDFVTLMAVWTTPPLLWTSIRAEWRSAAGDPMSGTEWVTNFIVGMICTPYVGAAMLVFVERVFPVYSHWAGPLLSIW